MFKPDNSNVRPIPISRSQVVGHGGNLYYPARSSLPDCSADHHMQNQSWSRKLSHEHRSGEMLDLTLLPQEINVSCVKPNFCEFSFGGMYSLILILSCC